MGIEIERLGGKDRYETAIKVAEQLGEVDRLAVASGENYADAISIGPIAAAMGAPVILVPKDYLPDSVKNYIKSKNVVKSAKGFKPYKVFVVGDNSIISDNITHEFENTEYVDANTEHVDNVERITGEDNYERNINCINVIGRFVKKYSVEGDLISFKNMYIASGEGFADALCGAALAAKTNSAIILSNDSNSQAIHNFILTKDTSPEYLTVLGGEGVLPQDRVNSIFNDVVYDDSVYFNDSNLESLIKDKIGVYDRNIQVSDLKNISSLNLTNQNITDITGIEKCQNLISLDLSYNNISDISPLLKLDGLKDLNLNNNMIEDISYISNLFSLRQLNLRDNKITDIDHSRDLTKDKDKDENNYEDYDLISENTFKRLTNLTHLDLSNSELHRWDGNNINNLSNLKDLTNLVSLNLTGTGITNLDDLKNLMELNSLYMGNNEIRNIDFIKNFGSLTYLDISNNYDGDNKIDLSPLKDIHGLKYLDARNNGIEDIYALRGLTNLNTLYLEDNPIKDYSPIIPYYNALYHKDFDIPNIGTPSTGVNWDDNLQDQLKTFEIMYGYNYEAYKYRQLYRAYDKGIYDSQLKRLNYDREWILSSISNGGFKEKEVKQMKLDLDNINYQIAEINKKNAMNTKIKDLQSQLVTASNPRERAKVINKINYAYADYRYDYYRNEANRYKKDVDEINSELLSIGTQSPNYSDNSTANYLKYQLDKKTKDRDFAQSKIKTYLNYINFFTAVNSLYEQGL